MYKKKGGFSETVNVDFIHRNSKTLLRAAGSSRATEALGRHTPRPRGGKESGTLRPRGGTRRERRGSGSRSQCPRQHGDRRYAPRRRGAPNAPPVVAVASSGGR